MKNRFWVSIVGILGILFNTEVSAQSKSDWDNISRVQLRTTVGIHNPIIKYNKKDVANQLLLFAGESEYYISPINGSYFFTPQWGIDLNVSFVMPAMAKRSDVETQLQREVANQFYLKDFAIVREEAPKIFFNVGAVYRIDRGSYFLMPKLSISTLSLDLSPVSFLLKEKNTNTYIHKKYQSEDLNKTYVGANLTLMGGYKLSKRFSVLAEVSGSWHQLKAKVVEVSVDAYSLIRTDSDHPLNKAYYGFNAGLGIMFMLNRNFQTLSKD